MGSPPGRPVKRPRTNFAGPVPECVHINKRITAAQSAEVIILVPAHFFILRMPMEIAGQELAGTTFAW